MISISCCTHLRDFPEFCVSGLKSSQLGRLHTARKKKEPNHVDDLLDELLEDCQSPEDIRSCIKLVWEKMQGHASPMLQP